MGGVSTFQQVRLLFEKSERVGLRDRHAAQCILSERTGQCV